jgi:hypothetical protein
LKKPIQVSLRSAQEAEELGMIWFAARVESKRYGARTQRNSGGSGGISKEDRLLRSLVENMARFPKPLDLIREIERPRAT